MDFKIIHIDEADSTNRWIAEHRDEWEHSCGSLVVVADYQTAGRGCGTNSWESERGKNLLFSMLVHPTDIPAREQFRITEIASVAMCQTLKQYRCEEVSIKWPNDIYVGDKKICGMLIENRLQGSVIKDSIIGIGLNVNQTVFVSDAPNPVSMKLFIGKETSLEELLNTYLAAFDAAFQSKTSRFVYKTMLFRKGTPYLYRDKTSCFTATLTDVLPDGRLLLTDQEGRERLYAFKEVQFII